MNIARISDSKYVVNSTRLSAENLVKELGYSLEAQRVYWEQKLPLKFWCEGELEKPQECLRILPRANQKALAFEGEEILDTDDITVYKWDKKYVIQDSDLNVFITESLQKAKYLLRRMKCHVSIR